MGGAVTPINLGKLVAKRASLIGTALRVRPLEQKIALSQRFAVRSSRCSRPARCER